MVSMHEVGGNSCEKGTPYACSGKRCVPMGSQDRLVAACESGDSKMLRRLLVDGADPNYKSVIVTAARNHHRECVRLLLHYGANPSPAVAGETALSYAVDNRDRMLVDMLLRGGADVNVHCERPALFRAVHHRDREIMLMLLSAGANIHTPTERYRLTVLHTAVINNDAVSLRMLAVACNQCPLPANVTVRCLDAGEAIGGDTPLHTAVRVGGARDIIETLLWFGADTQRRNFIGMKPEKLALYLPLTRRILATWAHGQRGLRRIMAAEAQKRVVPSLAQLCAVTVVCARVPWRLPTIPHVLRAVISQTTGWDADGKWDSVR